MDQKVLQENYNTTGNDSWQFVPSRSYGKPYFVICLIWTMPKIYHLSSDLNYEVSNCLMPNTFQESFNSLDQGNLLKGIINPVLQLSSIMISSVLITVDLFV